MAYAADGIIRMRVIGTDRAGRAQGVAAFERFTHWTSATIGAVQSKFTCWATSIIGQVQPFGSFSYTADMKGA